MKPTSQQESYARHELAYWRQWLKKQTRFDDMCDALGNALAKRIATRARRKVARQEERTVSEQ